MSNVIKNEWLVPHQFKKGNKLGGKPKLPDNLKTIRALSKHEVGRIISKIARMEEAQTEIYLANPQINMLEKSIAVIFMDVIEKKDFVKLNFLLDRSIGKCIDADLSDEDDEDSDIKKMTTGELLQLVKKMLPEPTPEEALENKE